MGSSPRGISASRAAAVLGLPGYQTQLEVFQRIMEEREPGWNAAHGFTLPPEPDNAAMRWGTAFESAVIELAERERGLKIIHREQAWSRGPKKTDNEKYITCHIDGRYDNNSGNYWSCDLHEGKTTSSFMFREHWGEPGTDKIPGTYQAQHQMLCTGAERVIVSVLVWPETPEAWEKMGYYVEESVNLFGKKIWAIWKREPDEVVSPCSAWANTLAEMGFFHQYTVEADMAAHKMMVERYERFWKKYVVPGVPPEPQNYDDVQRLFPEPKKTIVCNDVMASWFREYAQTRDEIGKKSAAQTRMDRLRMKILIAARKMEGAEDEESAEALIFRDEAGKKLGQFSKTKAGALVFRA
ncbi:MAG: YqaJ viral recombinase family protein [Treponema sp.]|jgi:hypothetical protein|nr:YqaJ viral recombinase family protein [Treponema sp.]